MEGKPSMAGAIAERSRPASTASPEGKIPVSSPLSRQSLSTEHRTVKRVVRGAGVAAVGVGSILSPAAAVSHADVQQELNTRPAVTSTLEAVGLTRQAGVFAAPEQQGPPYWSIDGGIFFPQEGSQDGFAVTDQMLGAYRSMGGDSVWGKPISRAYFDETGRLSQAFEKGIFQLTEGKPGQIEFANIFDELSSQGKDGWLDSVKQTPPPFDWSSDAGKSWPEVIENHLSILPPQLRQFVEATPDWIEKFGLPVSIEDYGGWVSARFQRTNLQLLSQDFPYGRQGEVVIANGGSVAKEAGGIIPQEALRMQRHVRGEVGQPGTVAEIPAGEIPGTPGITTGEDETAEKPWPEVIGNLATDRIEIHNMGQKIGITSSNWGEVVHLAKKLAPQGVIFYFYDWNQTDLIPDHPGADYDQTVRWSSNRFSSSPPGKQARIMRADGVYELYTTLPKIQNSYFNGLRPGEELRDHIVARLNAGIDSIIANSICGKGKRGVDSSCDPEANAFFLRSARDGDDFVRQPVAVSNSNFKTHFVEA